MDVSQSTSAAMAVLVDFESLPGDVSVSNLVRELGNRGRSVVKRAYGDWSKRGSASRDLLNIGFDLIEMPMVQRGSSRIDVRMAIDAMEIVYTKSYINVFAFVFGNSDYRQVSRKLRELNCRVIFAAKSNQATAFASECCDEWIGLQGRTKCTQNKHGSSRTGNEERSLPDHLLHAIACCLNFLHVGPSQKTELVRLAQATRRLYPDIQLSELGFGKSSSWAKLIQIMEQDRWCEVEYDTTANTYFVQPTPKLLALSEQDSSADNIALRESDLSNSESAVSENHLIPEADHEGTGGDCCHSVILPFASLKQDEQ